MLGEAASGNGALDRGLVAQMLAGWGLSAVRLRSTPGYSAAFSALPASVAQGGSRFWSTPRTRGRRDTLKLTSSSTAGRTRWLRRRRRSSMTRSTSAGSGISLVQMVNVTSTLDL